MIGAVVVALCVGVVPAASALPPDDDRSGVELVDLPDADKAEGENGGNLAELTTAEAEDPQEYDPAKVTAPAGGTVTEDIAGLTPGELVPISQDGVDLPVEVGAPESATTAEAAALEGAWQVSLAGQNELADTAIEGMALTVTPPAGATGDAVIALDYTDFSELYGANWADRLSFVQYPSCFLTTPDTEGCSEPTEVSTDNVVEQTGTDGDGQAVYERRILATMDVEVLAAGGTSTESTDTSTASSASTASASDEGTVGNALYREQPEARLATLAAATAGSGSSVLLATDSGSGSKGDFSATPLVSAGSWSAGGNSGGFTYSYTLQTPTVPGGPSPAVSFGYNSQGVDGRTSASNNQPSWIGDGWEYNAGSITRTYRSCRDDRTDGNNTKKTSDQCWGSYNAVMTLGGTTTELVLPDGADPTSDKWVTANGDGSRVELIKNTDLGNGDADGEYWRVTTRDGTQYYFGRHKLPGWASGDPTTNSVLSAPVAGNQSGEPCYKSGDFAGSFCDQAWRWNLDYVVDTDGNAMTMWWERETNYYAKNEKFKASVAYDRGGYLKKIEYGLRTGALFGTPIAKVTFDVDERCFKEGELACTEENFTSGDFGKNRIWYDTPADLYCAKGKECYVPVPTFWSRKRLAQVTTWAQRTQGSTELSKVDSFKLQQSLPADLTDEGVALWLESITRTGYDTEGEAIALNPVRFLANAQPMPNRVKEGANDPNPAFDRLRITRIVSEYGGETDITYKAPEGACKTGSGFPDVEDNTGLCFPVYWNPDPDKETIDWFHKYVVEKVQELPALTGVDPVTTEYDYLGGAAWALNQAEFSKKKTRTYDQWRGFARVRTYTGADSSTAYMSTEKGMTETRYFRGMHGDKLPGDEGTREVTVTDSNGSTIALDKEPFAGRVAETLTYTKKGGSLLTRDVDYPTATVLATRTRSGGIPALKAYRVLDDHSISVTNSSGTGDDKRTWRVLKTSTEYEDTYGLPVKVESLGDTDKGGDETCTEMSYVHNTDKHLIGLPRQTLTVAGTCGETPTAEDWTDGSRVAYDNGAYGDTPTSGSATTTWAISGSGGSWTQDGKVAYDDYGRTTSTTDAAGNVDKTAYTPSTGQVYQVKTTNALNQSETTTLEPARGVSLKETDANGHTTTFTYDALGRTTQAWAPTRSTSKSPSAKFTYDTTIGQPVSVTTEALKDNGDYEASTVIYDGLGRERQKQEPAVGKGRLITDVLYSANGTIAQTNNAYYDTGNPSTTLFELDSDYQVPNATLYSYDGLGRTLTETPYLHGTESTAKQTRYVYGDDYSTVIPPTGGAVQRSFSDAQGRTVRVDTFTDAARTEYRSTRYTYDWRGDQVKAEDSEGNTWTWQYDARGRQTEAVDPDTGTTTTKYDVLNRPETVTDENATVWTKYDALSRPVEQRENSSTGTLLASTEYDTLIGGVGLPTSQTRYTDGMAYTTSVSGYTADYQPLGKRITLPESIATSYGLQKEYAYGFEYSESGRLESVNLPAVGTFPAEKLVLRYNEDGLPVSTSGQAWYTAQTSYSPYGQVLRTASGEQPNRVWSTNLFDEATGELQRSIVDRESTSDTTAVTGHRVNSRAYAYDPAGNVTSIADTSNSVTDRQCFTYDALGQLTEAWTAPSACTAAGKTAAAPKYEDGTTNVTAANEGYWQSYEYDALGNRKKLVEHDPGLDTSKDATTTYSYGKEDGTQPHTLTGMSQTYKADSGAQVTKATKLTYDDAGNTKTRTYDGSEQALDWTWDGQVAKITGFGENGAGAWLGLANKCLDLAGASTTAGTALQLYSCNGSKAQKLRIDAPAGSSDASTGALKVLGKCAVPSGGATANATPVVIADCTGAEGQKWTATAEGTLKHVSSGKCLDVGNSNSADGTDLQLYTCNSTAAQSWTPDKETKYVYGGDGARLMAISATERTLYLGEATISLNANKTPAYTERYYSQPGAPTVMRHAQGSSAAELSAQVVDQNGTAYVNVALTSGNRVKFSKTDPFGVERSESTSWRSHRSYIGGDDDASSGLVHLGAREYDPTTGRFLSADPVLDLADPVQMNGYVYCENNPVTFADPSGLASEGGNGGDYGGPSASQESWAKKTLNTSIADVIMSVGWAALKDFVGWNDLVGCFSRGDLWACGSMVVGAIPWTKLGKIPGVLKAAAKIASAVSALLKAKEKARKIIEMAKKARELARKAKEAKKRAAQRAAQLKKKAKEAATRQVKRAAHKTGNAVQKMQKAVAKKAEAKPRQTRAKEESSGGGGGSCSKEESNSFTPGTKVLMADGTTKPIEKVENGDKVLATDPETGETSVETVTAEIKGEGVKHLVKVTIAIGDAENGDERTAELTATDGHPFWVPELGEWIDAEDLKAGQWLRTSAGTYVQITAIERWTATSATVHNLTVSDLHTYYVVAGSAPVLVHNCGANTDGYYYRGVVEGHHSYDTAAQGRAVPRGTSTNMNVHSGGDGTDTIFTSWSDDFETAEFFAQNRGDEWIGRGVMLRIRVASIDPAIGPSRNIQIHDGPYERFFEDEHLIVGEILADDISFDFGQTWTPVRRR
ncbi:ricin-type beta-trefoil lectin domain protein [Streptomyces phyllanthi]|uniref:ricin-type beta-trefoil lectin domain protein n=1 Tax=Streptomyces phyllanthi TaxID=1803180 RepID=UPI002AD3687D|nr:ricin-type beta-trefoil lectin domain protein [Streptomyces phyllanthi]